MMKKVLFRLCLVCCFTLLSGGAFAIEIGDDVFGGGSGGEVPPPPQNIPIDGGLSWLLAAGGVYGVSKLRKNFKK